MFHVNSAPGRPSSQIRGEMPRQPHGKGCFRNGSRWNDCTAVGVFTEPISHWVLALYEAPLECVTHINSFKLLTTLWNRLQYLHGINEEREAQRSSVTCSGSTHRTWTLAAGPRSSSSKAALCRLLEILPECIQPSATYGWFQALPAHRLD